MITSLHSPHLEVVKALLGSRGSKERNERAQYVIEGLQNVRAAVSAKPESLIRLYYTEAGASALAEFPATIERIEVSDQVMKAMSDTVSPQGLLALARIERIEAATLLSKPSVKRIAYFWEIQDPGNAGTVIRSADAFGFDGVIFSDNSVDIYSPKVVRSTAGSFWQIPFATGCSASELVQLTQSTGAKLLLTQAEGKLPLAQAANEVRNSVAVWVFGNEARGLGPQFDLPRALTVRIPMAGASESLNLASAAAVVMYAAATS